MTLLPKLGRAEHLSTHAKPEDLSYRFWRIASTLTCKYRARLISDLLSTRASPTTRVERYKYLSLPTHSSPPFHSFNSSLPPNSSPYPTLSPTMPISHTTPILIVGAGPAGLICALQLARHGMECMLVERNDDTTRWPKMDVTNCRSMELLRGPSRLGVGDGLRAVGELIFNFF